MISVSHTHGIRATGAGVRSQEKQSGIALQGRGFLTPDQHGSGNQLLRCSKPNILTVQPS
jgi:hypothetical protein